MTPILSVTEPLVGSARRPEVDNRSETVLVPLALKLTVAVRVSLIERWPFCSSATSSALPAPLLVARTESRPTWRRRRTVVAVSYTHLTLPTICSV